MGFESITNTNTSVIEKPRVDEMKPWNVVFYNDNFTTFDLVIFILLEVFDKSLSEAAAITQQVHEKGRAIVDSYEHEIAETKALEATQIARINNSPLAITIEQ